MDVSLNQCQFKTINTILLYNYNSIASGHYFSAHVFEVLKKKYLAQGNIFRSNIYRARTGTGLDSTLRTILAGGRNKNEYLERKFCKLSQNLNFSALSLRNYTCRMPLQMFIE